MSTVIGTGLAVPAVAVNVALLGERLMLGGTWLALTLNVTTIAA
jgi:hypothetical protein